MSVDDVRMPVARSVSASTQRIAMVSSSGSNPTYPYAPRRMPAVGGKTITSAAAPSYIAMHERPQMHWIGTPQSSTTSLGIHKQQSDASTPRLVSEASTHIPRTTSEPPPSLSARSTSIRTLPLLTTLSQSANPQSHSLQHGRVLTPQRVRAPGDSCTAATSRRGEAQLPEQLRHGPVVVSMEDGVDRRISDARLGRAGQVQGQVQIATGVPSFLPLAQTVRASSPCSGTSQQKAIQQQQASPALQRLKATAAGYGFCDAMSITAGADRAEEVLNALAKLQQSLDDQQVDQRNIITELSAQWEERFAQVMQCLEKSSTSPASPLPSNFPTELSASASMTPPIPMLSEIDRIWQHMDGITGRLDELKIKQRGMGNADLEELGTSEICADAGNRQGSCFLQITDHGLQEAQNGDGELARRKLFKGEDADSGPWLKHRLDLVDDKLQRLSQEFEVLRLEVLPMPAAELRTFGETPLLESSTVEPCVRDVPQWSMIHDGVASFGMPKPRGTGAGLLPPLDQAEESSGEEDMFCGAGSPPRRVGVSFGMTCTD